MNGQPIHINKVFDDPLAVRALVERQGPYRAMASYLPVSPTLGEHAIAAGGGTLPWFSGHLGRKWSAAGGRRQGHLGEPAFPGGSITFVRYNRGGAKYCRRECERANASRRHSCRHRFVSGSHS